MTVCHDNYASHFIVIVKFCHGMPGKHGWGQMSGQSNRH